MKFVPRDLPDSPAENVNVSPIHPLREFAWLLGGLLGLLLAVFLILGLLVDLVVPHVPASTEQALGKLFESIYAEERKDAAQARLQGIVDRLAAQLPEKPAYRVHLIPGPTVNAMAVPGGDILLYEGLLARANSENELAFVLGHEIGHLHYRHSLRAVGRALVLLTLADLSLGSGNPLSDMVLSTINGAQMRFSQRQESDSDALGLELLVKTYGHAGGATDFFARLAQKEKTPEVLSYLATHPHPAARVRELEAKIRTNGYASRPVAPLAPPLAIPIPPELPDAD